MNRLLQITGKDIGSLSDADLRELTGKLCEADYLQAGLSIRKITWGSDQDAADGGVDVRVRRLTEISPEIAQPPLNSDVPRAETVFQCKKAKNQQRMWHWLKHEHLKLVLELRQNNNNLQKINVIL
jgi:hypothetical protein